MTEPRIRRPVIVIGYGDPGEAWLERLAQRIGSAPVLEGMLRDGVIQFWAFGVGSAGRETIVTRFSDVPGAQEVRRRLDTARLARFQMLYGLDLFQPVLVLERWCLFNESSEPRVKLRDAISTARYVDCDPQKDRELDILWVTLADAVRAAAPPALASVRRIMESFRAETLHDVPFLIDRQSSDGGVIDPVLADRCYYDFATATLMGDLAFPTRGGGDRRSSVFSNDADSGRVHPLSVVVLRHPESGILAAAARDLRREIREGDRQQLLQWASSAVPLTRVLENEVTLRQQGLLSFPEARSRRNEAAAVSLGAAIALRDTQVLQQDLRRTRERVNAHYPDMSPQVPGVAIAGGLAADSLSAAQIHFGMLEVGIAAAVLLTAVGAFWWRHRTVRAEPLVEQSNKDSLSAAQLRLEWLELLDRTEVALRQMESLLINSHDAAQGTWRLADEHPFEWRFQPVSVHPPGELALTQSLVQSLAHRILDSVDAVPQPEEAVNEALRATVSDLLSKRSETYRTCIARALANDDAQVLRSALKGAPLLVNSGRPIANAEILWLADRSLELDDALVQLEPATMRHDARVLTSDDPTQTVRIRIGEALEWPAVLSLHFLAN